MDNKDKFKCHNFYKNKCYLIPILEKTKTSFSLKKLGEATIAKIAKDPNFNFITWFYS
jgi:adenine-specific DNA methylase